MFFVVYFFDNETIPARIPITLKLETTLALVTVDTMAMVKIVRTMMNVGRLLN